jgi:hypothetical protein
MSKDSLHLKLKTRLVAYAVYSGFHALIRKRLGSFMTVLPSSQVDNANRDGWLAAEYKHILNKVQARQQD